MPVIIAIVDLFDTTQKIYLQDEETNSILTTTIDKLVDDIVLLSITEGINEVRLFGQEDYLQVMAQELEVRNMNLNVYINE